MNGNFLIPFSVHDKNWQEDLLRFFALSLKGKSMKIRRGSEVGLGQK